MKKRTISLLLTGSLLTGLISGCGQTSSVTDDAVQTSDNASAGTISLTVWGAEEDQELLQEITSSFAQEYAGEASFDITIAAESESTCKDTLLTDLENGADVFTFVDDQLNTLAAAGAIEPIEDADTSSSRNLENAVAAASINDQLYAYPMTADNGYFMYYNKAYFSENDVATLDQMLNIAAAANKKVTMDWTSGWYLYAFFGLTGLEVGLNDNGLTNYCTWNDTENSISGVDVAQAMLSIASNPGFLNTDDTSFVDGVKDGSVIAGVSGVWNSTDIQDAWGKDYGAVKLPTYTVADQQVQMSSFSGYKLIGVNAYSKNYEWASKLADWITNEENQMLRFTQRGQGPSNINAADSAEVSDSLAIQALLQQSDYSTPQRIGGNYWDPVSAFGTNLANGNPGGESLQTLLDTMVKSITAQISY